MNNNDFYGNLDRIRKLYLKQDYDEAVRIADKMDFKRLKDWKYIAMLINLYESVGRLEDVRYFCILAYNRNLGGKKLVYKLTKVSIRLEEIDEAEELYEEYVEMAGRDNKRYELLYELKAVQGAKKAELIKILEDYMKRDLDEKYALTLAELYAKTNQNDKCVGFCSRIIDRFEEGEVVEKARALKNKMLDPVASAAQSSGGGQQAKQPEEAMKAPGQNTIGLNVEQIMAARGDDPFATGQMNTTTNIQIQDMYATGNVPMQDMYATQGVPMQDMYATQGVPMQDMYATQGVPMQDMYVTQGVPMQDMYAAQDVPMQDMYATQDVPVQGMYVTQGVSVQNIQSTQNVPVQELQATQVIPVQEVQAASDVKQDLAKEKVTTQELQATQVIPVQEVKEQIENTTNEALAEATVIEEQPAEQLDEEKVAVPVVNENETQSEDVDVKAETVSVETEPVVESGVLDAQQDVDVEAEKIEEEVIEDNVIVSEQTEMIADMSNTVRVDTDSINAAMQEAAATKDTVVTRPNSDMDSTMAIVEAALANETQAAQFDARMDMPEYSEEYTAPVKDKVVLRPFQPEIDKVYEIPMEVKRYFTKYNYVSGLEAQIGEYFESTKYEDKMGTSGIGNIIISGNRSSDKTTLAINIVKALNTIYADNVKKIARTNGDSINQRGIERSVGKLLGSALIIEEAGVMDRQRILEMIEVLESDTQEMLIILEDSESEINELLKNNPELIEKFNHRITYKQFTVNELVEMCKRYADKCQYAIDEKALLQLYLRIDGIHSNGDGVSLEDVRDVVDVAIENAERRASKKLFGGVKKKKVGDREYVVLVEADFKE